MRNISATKTCTYGLGAVLIVKYCEKFVEDTKKAMFFLEKHVIRGGGAVVHSLGKKTHPVLFLQSRGPLGNLKTGR